MGYGAMSGTPMVASSPVRHESPLNMHGLEVTAYQPPWKALSDFALHADLENNVNTHTPAFQHLVNQVSELPFMRNRKTQLDVNVKSLLIADARLRYGWARWNAASITNPSTSDATEPSSGQH